MSIGWLEKSRIWWNNQFVFLSISFKIYWKYNMYNIISYIVYIIITFYITIFVGWRVYKLGFIYLENLIDNHSVCQSINNLLLIGYYLVNLGFSAISLQNWERVDTITIMLSSLSYKIGFILLVLGILHFINLSIIYIARKNKKINS